MKQLTIKFIFIITITSLFSVFFYSSVFSMPSNNKSFSNIKIHTKTNIQLNSTQLIKIKTLQNGSLTITGKNTFNTPLKNKLTDILTNTPMKPMIDSISQQDKIIAAFLVGIALKESGLGKHSPILNGKDCYNYWGYRGKRKRMGSGGHTCFDSPEDAVETVSKRLHTLVIEQQKNTPEKMLIWKCGNICSTHKSTEISKWINDVSIYFNQINNSSF